MKVKQLVFVAAAAAVLAAAAFALSGCTDAVGNEMERVITEKYRPTITPVDGAIIPAHEIITLTFTQSMDPASVTVSGDIILGTLETKWDTVTLTNDTLELNYYEKASPKIGWDVGTGKQLAIAVTISGQTAVYNFSFEVFKGACVSQGGDDGNTGTAGSPLATIKNGLAKASSLYSSPSEVHVSGGNYYVLSTASNGIVMVDGLSLRGGYATDWTGQDWNQNETIITDQRAGTAEYGTVKFGSGITSSTAFEGFTLYGATGDGSSYSIWVVSSSPTIRNNKIIAGGDAFGALRYGIYIDGLSSDSNPIIQSNQINSSTSGGGSNVIESIGISILGNSNAIIKSNTIYAGTVSSATGDLCNGIQVSLNYATGSLVIERNCIFGGIGGFVSGYPYSNATICFYQNISVPIELRNNLIINDRTFIDQNNRYCIYYNPSQNNPSLHVRNNTFVLASTNGLYNGCVLFLGAFAGTPTLNIDNNVFYYPSNASATNAYFIYENAAWTPTTVHNNDFIGYYASYQPIVYHDSTGVDLSLSQLNSGTKNGLDNLAVDPVLNSSTYRTTSSAPSTIKSNGIDGSANSWGFNNDLDGKTRTGSSGLGWTIGCIEID